MNVMDIIALHPDAGDILAAYGLHCFHCAFNTLDTLEAGARSHGLTDTDIENLVIDLEELLEKTPQKPQIITLTKEAAQGLQLIGKQEKKESIMLRVTQDNQGNYCMEFDETVGEDDRTFLCEGIENVCVVASEKVLWSIGGSTIDMRDGRFTLDLKKGSSACKCETGTCGCKAS